MHFFIVDIGNLELSILNELNCLSIIVNQEVILYCPSGPLEASRGTLGETEEGVGREILRYRQTDRNLVTLYKDMT